MFGLFKKKEHTVDKVEDSVTEFYGGDQAIIGEYFIEMTGVSFDKQAKISAIN